MFAVRLKPCCKAMTCTTYSFYVLVMAGRGQRFAQPSNMNINGSLLDKYMVSPYILQSLSAAKNPLRMHHKKMQSTKFCRPQAQVFTVGVHTVCAGVQAEGAYGDLFIG